MQGAALITGGSRGIGRAIAAGLAAAGYGVTVSARDKDTLEAAAHELESSGSPALAVPGDMAVEDDVRALARAHAERFGRLDVLVLGAGVGTAGDWAGYSMKRFDKQVAVNLRSPFLLVSECLELMRSTAKTEPARGAKVIALASITGVVSEPSLAAYGATKAALISLCQSLCVDESANGVSATAISPGYVDTDMTAWVRDRLDPQSMIAAEDIAEMALALTRLSARTVVPHVVMARAGAELWRA